jgi:pimeloyl-ACP methyl ester carboxylesterase
MVLPGGPDFPVPLAIEPDDLRQLADHDAAPRTFAGRAGPLAALDTGGEAVRGTALLVAGYTGSKEDFAPILAPLAEAGYRVVALDQRGQFESPGPDDPAEYSVEDLGRDVLEVARVLREESGEPLHLLGHSFGGLVTRAAVLLEPALFTSFTLLGSGPSKLTGRRADLLDHLGPLLDAGGVELVHQTLEQVSMTDERAQAVPAPTREFYSRRFLTGLPVLVAHGEADDAWLPHVQEDMASRLGARHEVILNSIHSPAVENPGRTVDVLLDFWAGASAVQS